MQIIKRLIAFLYANKPYSLPFRLFYGIVLYMLFKIFFYFTVYLTSGIWKPFQHIAKTKVTKGCAQTYIFSLISLEIAVTFCWVTCTYLHLTVLSLHLASYCTIAALSLEARAHRSARISCDNRFPGFA